MSVPTYSDLAEALYEFHRAYNADGNPVETIADLEAASEQAADLVSRAPKILTPEQAMREAVFDLRRGDPERAQARLRSALGEHVDAHWLDRDEESS